MDLITKPKRQNENYSKKTGERIFFTKPKEFSQFGIDENYSLSTGKAIPHKQTLRKTKPITSLVHGKR